MTRLTDAMTQLAVICVIYSILMEAISSYLRHLFHFVVGHILMYSVINLTNQELVWLSLGISLFVSFCVFLCLVLFLSVCLSRSLSFFIDINVSTNIFWEISKVWSRFQLYQHFRMLSSFGCCCWLNDCLLFSHLDHDDHYFLEHWCLSIRSDVVYIIYIVQCA